MTSAEKSKLQKEILDSLPPMPVGRLLLAPRVGKTKLIIDLIKRDRPLTILWVTPSTELATVDIPAEFKKWKATKYLSRLRTSTWMGLKNIVGEFDIIIFDEDQFITRASADNLIEGKLKGNTIISMTGTASRDKLKNDLYEFMGLETLYELDLGKAVDIGLLANYSITVIGVPMDTKNNITAGNKKVKFMTSEAKQYAYVDKNTNQAIAMGGKTAIFKILNRMRTIKNSPSKLRAAKELIAILGGRKLIFAATIDQSKQLSPYLYNSKTKGEDLLAFKNGEIDSLALVNSGGTGFTYKAIDNLILVQADSDTNGLTSQKISRTLLGQPDYKAKIWIICLKGTQDIKWIRNTLKRFDPEKIEFLEYEQFKQQYYGDKSKSS